MSRGGSASTELLLGASARGEPSQPPQRTTRSENDPAGTSTQSAPKRGGHRRISFLLDPIDARMLYQSSKDPKISWTKRILPMQKRVAKFRQQILLPD